MTPLSRSGGLISVPSPRASRVFVVLQDEQGEPQQWVRGWLRSYSLDMSIDGPASATLALESIEVYEGAPPSDFGRMKPKEMPLSPERVRRMALGEEEV